jgi:hypothetical protein
MTTKQDLILYLHRAAFSPVVSNWTKAINAGFFTTWPGLTSGLVRKHFSSKAKKIFALLKSYQLQQFLPNLALAPTLYFSTQSRSPAKSLPIRLGAFLTIPAAAANISWFSTHMSAMPSYQSPSSPAVNQNLCGAYTKLHNYLSARGLKPKFQGVDNECPAALKTFMSSNNIKFQLVPPYLHRTKAAEKAIGIYKDHLIAGLSSCDPSFLMHLWDCLLPQATLTLNLVRFWRINLRLSAEAQLSGAFDFNQTPLAPPGTRVLVNKNPEKRRTWAVQGVDGWYIGSAPKHYQCYKVYIPKTRAERTAHGLDFVFPQLPCPHNIFCQRCYQSLPGSCQFPFQTGSSLHFLAPQ